MTSYLVRRLVGTIPVLLLITLLVFLLLLFLLPPLWFLGGSLLLALTLAGQLDFPQLWCLGLIGKGLLVWWLMARVYRPSIVFFGLKLRWRWTLPAAGLLYGAMTVDSAIRHARGRWQWR